MVIVKDKHGQIVRFENGASTIRVDGVLVVLDGDKAGIAAFEEWSWLSQQDVEIVTFGIFSASEIAQEIAKEIMSEFDKRTTEFANRLWDASLRTREDE